VDEDRIRGCILGGAIGDALGAAVEFDSIDDIRRRFGDAGLTDYAEAYGRTGAITDDTQMTLWTAYGLIRAVERYRGKGIVNTAQMVDLAYASWLGTQGEESGRWRRSMWDGPFLDALRHRRAPGNTCLSALRADRMGKVEEPLNDSKGCGGVMRIAPVGLSSVMDPFDMGCQVAAITHGHPSGYLAAGALAETIAGIRRGLSPDAALDEAERRLGESPRHEEVLDAVRAARSLAASGAPEPGPEAIATLGAGWVAEEALAIAVYCALVARDFAHGVLLAVNHSGDSDSTGAITGNILGALLGYGALPARWLDGLELRDPMEALAGDFIAQFASGDAPEPGTAIGSALFQ
jgi:ADP-ribosylglycohydrolase